MEDPALSTNYVDGPALRRYNIFKYTILLLLAALLLGLSLRCARFNDITAPTLSGPAGTLTAGAVTLSGTGTPGSTIDLWLDGASLDQTTVAKDGTWSLNTDLAAPGSYGFQAFALDPDGIVRGESSLLTLPVADAIATEPEPTAEPASEPTATPAETNPEPTAAAATSLRVTESTLEDVAREGDLIAGNYYFAGVGEPGATIELYMTGADGTILPIGTTTVADDGSWSLAGHGGAPAGTYIVSANMLAPDGTLLDNDDIAELPLELGVDIPVFGGIADDADGRRTLTGFAAPFTEVEILINGELAGTATSDGAGDWSFDLGDRRFDLELELRAAADPLLTTGPFGVFNRARIILDDVASEELALDNFALNIAGHAEPGSQVGIYLNDELIQIVPVAADGSWSYFGEHPRGLYDLTVGYGDISLAISEPWNISQSLTLGGPVGQLQIALGGEDASPTGLGVAPPGGPVVHIILDASWSMTDPLGDATRFEVARAAVAGIINNSLPDNTPVSLRIFGNLEGDLACQTDLMIPYGPLDRAAFNEVLNAAEPQFDANTAIAASLAAVPVDLAAAPEEEHIIVLLTDGQETCGGDPAAEIQALNDAGFNVVVNIVGLSIDDEALAAQFAQWAELGNGTYFAADDAEGLNSAVADAMRISYLVYDETAEIVAIGRIGGSPINLPPGSYTIEVLTAPRTIFTEVEIVADELTSFSLTE